jgi:hypothetical protein
MAESTVPFGILRRLPMVVSEFGSVSGMLLSFFCELKLIRLIMPSGFMKLNEYSELNEGTSLHQIYKS